MQILKWWSNRIYSINFFTKSSKLGYLTFKIKPFLYQTKNNILTFPTNQTNIVISQQSCAGHTLPYKTRAGMGDGFLELGGDFPGHFHWIFNVWSIPISFIQASWPAVVTTCVQKGNRKRACMWLCSWKVIYCVHKKIKEGYDWGAAAVLRWIELGLLAFLQECCALVLVEANR